MPTNNPFNFRPSLLHSKGYHLADPLRVVVPDEVVDAPPDQENIQHPFENKLAVPARRALGDPPKTHEEVRVHY